MVKQIYNFNSIRKTSKNKKAAVFGGFIILLNSKKGDLWSWRESNPRPNKEQTSFLHVYLFLGFLCKAWEKAPKSLP